MSVEFPTSEAGQASNEVIQEVLRAISQLRYGSVEITVHEGKVTQIERREKVRFAQPLNRASGTNATKDTPTAPAVATS